jgi:uncharacterized protein
MKNKLTLSRSTRNLVAYFGLAYAISWAIGVPLALGKQGILQPVFPLWMHYFVAFGPMLSALIVTFATQGQVGLKELGKRVLMWNVRPIWWFVAISPLMIGFVVALILNLATNNQVTLSDLGQVNFLPPLGIGAWLLWICTFGIGEEVGWRGYALPRLQQGRSALAATMILAVLWALWHLPQFFYLFDPAIAFGWVIGLFAGAIVFTWLFNSSGSSILILAVWHGCFNFISATDAGNGILAAVVSTIVMVWAVVIVVVFKPKNLSHREKIVA